MTTLLDLHPKASSYYAVTVGMFVASGAAAGSLAQIADGGTAAQAGLTGLSAGLMTLTVVGSGAWLLKEWIRGLYIQMHDHALEQIPPPTGFIPLKPAQAVQVYASEVQDYTPDLVTIQMDRRGGVTLHVAPDQLHEMKTRIRHHDRELAINGWKTITSTLMRDYIRPECVKRGLAERYGRENKQVRWTQEGALAVMRTPPPKGIRVA